MCAVVGRSQKLSCLSLAGCSYMGAVGLGRAHQAVCALCNGQFDLELPIRQNSFHLLQLFAPGASARLLQQYCQPAAATAQAATSGLL